MVILKLIAWSDRPEERENDLSDILNIIQHYYNLKWDEIVEMHFDTLDKEPFDELQIAAEVLGRHAKLYLQKSEAISTRVMKLLVTNLEDASKSAIARDWAKKIDKEIEYAFALLGAFQRGITQAGLNVGGTHSRTEFFPARPSTNPTIYAYELVGVDTHRDLLKNKPHDKIL
jgi:predicted nucleotidyltransferase